jgi:hypothetical protein
MNKEKQIQAETEFQKYLDKNKIPFWYIEQNFTTFSTALKELNIQRPDYVLFIKNIGLIFIDVEHNIPLEKYNKFCISEIETYKYNNLKKYFNIEVWYALSNEKIHYTTWYLINITKIISMKHFLVKDKHYFSLPIEEFKQVSSNEKITKIFLE